MTTRLNDIFNQKVYQALDPVESVTRTSLYTSGAVVQNSALDQRADRGDGVVYLPFWHDLSDDEANVSNDDPESKATAGKLTQGAQIARVSYLNKSFGAADLVSEITGGQPLQHIRNRFGAYWQRQFQSRTIATLTGVTGANSDMVVDVSGESANKMDSDVVIEGQLSLGDHLYNLAVLVVHSRVYGQIKKDIVKVEDTVTGDMVEEYMGCRVIVNDAVPKQEDGENGYTFTSYLMGNGALGYGEGSPSVPVEVERQGQAGNGGGIEAIIERQTYILHPFGYKWKGDDEVEKSPKLAGLENSNNWERVIDRKLCPIVALKTK